MAFIIVVSTVLVVSGGVLAVIALVRLRGVIRRPPDPAAAPARELRSLEQDYAYLEDRLTGSEEDDSASAELERSGLREEMADVKRSIEGVRQKLEAAKAQPSTAMDDWVAAHPLEYRRGMATAACAFLMLLLAVAFAQLAGTILFSWPSHWSDRPGLPSPPGIQVGAARRSLIGSRPRWSLDAARLQDGSGGLQPALPSPEIGPRASGEERPCATQARSVSAEDRPACGTVARSGGAADSVTPTS